MSKPFQFPPVYNFPPFWTIQPVQETKRRQFEMWLDLIMKYMKFKNETTLEIRNAIKTELFNNPAIQRSLTANEVTLLINELVQRQNAEWIDAEHKKCKIIWRKADEWAAVIYKWAQTNSMIGAILTFYEIRESDDTQGEPFHMMDITLLRDAIKHLASKNKAVFIEKEELDECGVRFK